MTMMNEAGATAILTLLKAAYPNSYKDLNRRDAKGIISTWAEQLSDAPAEAVLLAVKQLISTKTFPPSIAEVREKIVSLSREAEGCCRDRMSMRRLMANKDSEGEIPVTEQELYMKHLYEITRHFKAEAPLYAFMPSQTKKKGLESSFTAAPALLG
jgi:hypothetical protein